MQLIKIVLTLTPLVTLAMASANPFAFPQSKSDNEIVTECLADARCSKIQTVGEECAKDIKDLDMEKIKSCTCKALDGHAGELKSCASCYKEKGFSQDVWGQYQSICKEYGVSFGSGAGALGSNWAGVAAGAIVCGGMLL